MITNLFTIYDQKAEAYNAPFAFGAVGQALRAFADLVNDKNSNLNKHPADYNLFQIGTYDDATASVQPLTVNINLGCAIEFLVLEGVDPGQLSFPLPPAAADGLASNGQEK